MTSMYDIPPDISVLNGRTLFIGLGAMKAGTSWVSDYLRGHPNVYHSPIKEMNFFNKLVQNPLSSIGPDFRMRRMRKILLDDNRVYPPTKKKYETLQTLAELDALKSEDDYLSFFARRIGNQSHFGEICPQYSLIPIEIYQRIAKMGFDTRLMFFMRDPTDRLASHLQHLLRRSEFNIDQKIATLTRDDLWCMRSNYVPTLENIRKAETELPLETFVYEELFTNESVRKLCNFLGIAYRLADFGKRVNVARGQEITAKQKNLIREKLDPIYRELADYLGDDKPAAWRWTS